MKKILLYTLLLVAIFSCSTDDNDHLDLTANVDISKFVINGVEGTINNKNATINVILPLNTSLHALTPVITLPSGASVSPESGVAIDFSKSMDKGKAVEYLVKNGNLYQKYSVVVNEARAKITKFTINNVAGVINEANRTIKVALPDGTDLRSLKPIVEYTLGAKMTPSEGTIVDFTNPVTYTLEYYGNTFEYKITVDYGNLVLYDGETVVPEWAKIAVGSLDSKFTNPLKNGINTSDYCASFIRKKQGGDDGGRTFSGGALSNLDIDPQVYDRFTLMVLKDTAGDVQLEIQGENDSNKDYLKVYYNTPGEWQELTFMTPKDRTAIIKTILVAPHVSDSEADPNFQTQRVYWDNLIAILK